MVGIKTHAPRSFRLLVWLVVACSLLVFGYSWRVYTPYWSIQLVLVTLAAALSEFFSFELPNFTLVLSYPLAMSAVVLGGPAASGLVAACSAISVSDIRRRRPPAILAFNLASLVLVSSLAGWAYVGLGGPILANGPGQFTALVGSDFPQALWAMVASAVVAAVGNLVVISLGVSLYQGQGYRRIFLSGLPIMPTQLALPFVGFLMAQVLAISVVALPLFVFPLVVARQFYERSTRLRAAYADTVRSLVGALEAKDPYTRGHSERVADYAIALGRALEMDDPTIDRLEYSALLHDLGKLAVPGTVLTKPGRLTDEEYESIREHPGRGAAMVARIPPLRDLADFVGNHHERHDGKGYPNALQGEDIPSPAQVLAIADSYDAMTTTRAYRPALTHQAALDELVAGAGTQFEPDMVAAFVRAGITCEQGNDVAHRSDDAAVAPSTGEARPC